MSGMKARSLVVLYNHFAVHWLSAQSDALNLLLLLDALMSCCAADTNGCLDLRCRAFPLAGQVNAEWRTCPGSIAWHARDSVAPLRRSSWSWMLARIGRLPGVVGRRHPVTIHKASLIGQWGRCKHCSTRLERSTLLLNGPGLGWMSAKSLLQHPSPSQQIASGVRHVMSTFW